MPISGNASYLPTADAFVLHWTTANTQLGVAGPVLTATGDAVADLSALRNGLATQFTTVTQRINDVEMGRATLAACKVHLRDLVASFNEAVRGRLAGSRFVAALPAVPAGKDSAETIAQACDDVAHLWEQIDDSDPVPGFTPPLVLNVTPANDPEGDPVAVNRAAFVTELAQLKSDTIDLNHADQNLIMTRDGRDREKKRLYNVLKAYRAAIPGFFPEGSPIRESLPALTPAPGSTPDAVTATGDWDETEVKGRISFTASDNANLDRYEIRYSPGTEYHTADEVTVGSVAPAGPLEFLTLDGLTQPGVTALFRVYVVLTTGNEKGSNTVIITRPA